MWPASTKTKPALGNNVKLSAAPKLLEFLGTEKVANLAVPVDTAGMLHIATMIYMHTAEPLRFYFMTSNKSEKCRLVNERPISAACNVGTYYGTPFTLQMRGTAQLLDKTKHADKLEAYMHKRGISNKNVEGSDSVLLEFVPTWARFTDYAKGWGTTKLEVQG